MTAALAHLRADYDTQAGKSLALPLAGATVWAAAGIVSLFVSPRNATFVLILATGVIFPLGLLFARVLREKLLNNTNPLAKLMALCVLMVNLLWAVHLTLLYTAPDLIPLTLGIGLGLHWIVFSWIIQHPVGIIHAIARTLLATVAWWAFPDHRVGAVCTVVVLAYLYTVVTLRGRRPNTVALNEDEGAAPESAGRIADR